MFLRNGFFCFSLNFMDLIMYYLQNLKFIFRAILNKEYKIMI